MNTKTTHDTPIFVVIIISVVSLLLVGFYQPSNLLSQSSNNDDIIDLGQPLYSEHYKLTSHKDVVINGTKVTEVTFAGNGTTNGIHIMSNGHGLIFPRSGGLAYIKGKDDFVTTPPSGKATYTFQAMGNYGIALFNANATGSLSFLSNTVAVYKVDKNTNGTSTFTMWKWGK